MGCSARGLSSTRPHFPLSRYRAVINVDAVGRPFGDQAQYASTIFAIGQECFPAVREALRLGANETGLSLKGFEEVTALSPLAASCEAQPTISSQASSSPCTEFGLPEDAKGVECYKVDVHLRHDVPDGDTISLAVARIAAVEADGPADPLFMAQGGPGGATIATYAAYLLSNPEARPTANR
ncbi:hypothetical protein [Silicimonas sp. MF1-12-2]|uniref:hypothetical protein n=1 Tax=Silicimonas sp. MF1-12-2 TaxID=3384793 RepID=UPI0039B40AB8